MGSHSLLIVLERLTMHLSWISIVFQVLVFQIITTQIYGEHTSNYGIVGIVQGQEKIGGFDLNWRFGRSLFRSTTLTKDKVRQILHDALCGKIEEKGLASGSIEAGSCMVQVLDYNAETG